MVEQLSCTTCRIRKTRCNKVHPCQHCQQGRFECTFPTERRRPRDSRRQLAQRLEKIESKFTALAQALSSETGDRSFDKPERRQHAQLTTTTYSQAAEASSSKDSAQKDGQLSVFADRSRYSSSSLWTSLGEEIAEMRDLLDDDTFGEDTRPAQGLPYHERQENAGIFPIASEILDPLLLKPSPSGEKSLWTVYESNVAPLVTVFHQPSLKVLYEECTKRLHQCTRVETVFVCAVNFAAVVSLNPEDCEAKFAQTKAQIVQHYRCAAEQAFNEAGLLNTMSVSVLQAFVLYLTSLRRCDETWLVHVLTGVAVRLAYTLGLHQDGSNLGLDGFSTEMRRRLWWHLMLMDADLSEAHGVDSLIDDVSYNTQVPTNLDEVDMQPGMATPKPRMGFTYMTPSIMRYEILLASRKIRRQRKQFVFSANSIAANNTSSDEMKTIDELRQFLEERFLRYCSRTIPIQWAAAQIVQMKCQMLRFGVYHLLRRNGESDAAREDQAIHDSLFAIAVDVVDTVGDLESNPKSRQWGWFFRSDIQWPALVYLLNEVIQRPASPSVNQAWSLIKKTRREYHVGTGPEGARGARGMLFRPMRELTAKAFVIKDAEAQQQMEQDRVGRYSEAVAVDKDEPSGRQHPYRTWSGDVRVSGEMINGSNSWPSDQLSAFQEFWESPEPLNPSLFVGGQSFENLLL